MKELVFQVKFLSDIILQSTSNTEGNIQQLDFIAGSNFLGMVAKDYNKFKDSFNIFHSGKVRFTDATILKDDKQTYKMPLSFFHEKLNDKVMLNHHHIKDFSKYIQLKQFRKGYLTKDKEFIDIKYNYSQKSAYDIDKRKSKDSSMFGYNSIKQGSNWQFTLKYDDISDKDLELIKSNLIGVQRLGKSKSAQYGQVEITLNGSNENIEDLNLKDETILYLNSRLALIDDNGNPTYDLKYICDGLSDENIIYNKSQIKISSFTPYNGARRTKDYERVIINKGGVIVLKDISKEQLEIIKNGVGAYLSDGFGDILINPIFLKDENRFKLIKDKDNSDKKEDQREIIKNSSNDNLTQFLINKSNLSAKRLKIEDEVRFFIDKHKNSYLNMNSQWGTIRSICANSSHKTILDNVEEYIGHGIKEWESSKKTKLINAIKTTNNPLEFTKLLSMQMPKIEEVKNDK